MAGTKTGSMKAVKTIIKKYGEDFYINIGSKGGLIKSPLKGFGTNRQLAREAGRKGGTISKRGKSKS